MKRIAPTVPFVKGRNIYIYIYIPVLNRQSNHHQHHIRSPLFLDFAFCSFLWNIFQQCSPILNVFRCRHRHRYHHHPFYWFIDFLVVVVVVVVVFVVFGKVSYYLLFILVLVLHEMRDQRSKKKKRVLCFNV